MENDWANHFFIYILLALLGLSLGSFLNVVIYRLPFGKSIIKPRSFCPSCGTTIPLYYNIPILSYLLLRGHCKYCGKQISPRYLLVEFTSALIVVGYYIAFGPSWQFVAYTLFTLALLAVFLIDFVHYIIPDQITYPGIVIGVLFSLVNPQITVWQSLLGVLVGGGGLLLVGILGDLLFRKESLGGGDIKLAAMLGAFLGWKNVLFIFISASVIGLIASIIAMVFSSSLRESRRIPFGPFLATAAVAAIFFGDYLINLYISSLQ
jgi:leader peptidase (prepilin peptidase)/N-methyltransferase